jgi:hypothetical protein
MDGKEVGDEDVDWFQMVQAGSSQGTVVGFSEHGHELLSSEKANNFLPAKRQ